MRHTDTRCTHKLTTYVHTYAHAYAYAYAYAHIRACTHTHMCIHTCMHTHAHTHTRMYRTTSDPRCQPLRVAVESRQVRGEVHDVRRRESVARRDGAAGSQPAPPCRAASPGTTYVAARACHKHTCEQHRYAQWRIALARPCPCPTAIAAPRSQPDLRRCRTVRQAKAEGPSLSRWVSFPQQQAEDHDKPPRVSQSSTMEQCRTQTAGQHEVRRRWHAHCKTANGAPTCA